MRKNVAMAFAREHGGHGPLLVVALLLSADLAFVVLHCVHKVTPWLSNPMLSVEQDAGYPETYQYLKWWWVLMLLGYLGLRQGSAWYGVWALVFAYFLCDDALAIHERAGGQLATGLALQPLLGLRDQDLGELAVSAVAAAVLLPLVAWAYRYGPPAFKRFSREMIVLVLVLAVLGVAVDALHVVVQSDAKANFFFGLLEDGGEMVVSSLMLGCASLHALAGRGARLGPTA